MAASYYVGPLCYFMHKVGGSFGLFASGSHTAGKEPLLALYRARVLSWHGLHYAATPAAHRILLVDKVSPSETFSLFLRPSE